MRLSRRAFLAGAGGGLVAIASATAIWRSRQPVPRTDRARTAPDPLVDRQGWMVTAADEDKLPPDQLAIETE